MFEIYELISDRHIVKAAIGKSLVSNMYKVRDGIASSDSDDAALLRTCLRGIYRTNLILEHIANIYNGSLV
jgi:hypothetical protein